MSRGRDDFEERLRRALHDAADRVEPADGGLDRIRRSVPRPRPVLLAAMMAACAAAARRACTRSWPGCQWSLPPPRRPAAAAGHAALAGPGQARLWPPCWPLPWQVG